MQKTSESKLQVDAHQPGARKKYWVLRHDSRAKPDDDDVIPVDSDVDDGESESENEVRH